MQYMILLSVSSPSLPGRPVVQKLEMTYTKYWYHRHIFYPIICFHSCKFSPLKIFQIFQQIYSQNPYINFDQTRAALYISYNYEITDNSRHQHEQLSYRTKILCLDQILMTYQHAEDKGQHSILVMYVFVLAFILCSE